MSKQQKIHHFLGLVVGSAVVLLSCVLAMEFVKHQLGGYDMSPLIDLQWRLSRGEIPGQHFINTWPPLILLGIKAVAWAPFAWTDLTLINAVATVLTFAWLLAMDGMAARRAPWVVAVAFSLSMPLLHTNHIWHSSISQLAAVLFFHSSLRLFPLASRPPPLGLLALFVSAGLVAISKQNIGPPALVACLGYCALFERNRRGLLVAIIVLVGAMAGILASSLALGSTPESFIYIYRAVVNRFDPDPLMWWQIRAVNTYLPLLLLSCCLALLLVWRYQIWPVSRQAAYAWLMMCAAMLPVLTDWDVKINDAVLPLFILAGLLFPHTVQTDALAGAGATASDSGQPIALFLYYCLFMLALIGGYERERMRLVGSFYEKPAGRLVDSGYFKGLETGPTLDAIIKEMHRAVANGTEPVFFGPCIEFGYMETATRSPYGLPLWWHPGTAYAKEDTPRVVAAFERQGFKRLIFARNNRFRMPMAVLKYIEDNYRRVDGYAVIDVYERKP